MFPEYDLQRAYRRLPVYDEKNREKAEVDILLVNTEWAMAVEVKRQADAEDVKEHIERMERILKYPPAELEIRPDIKLLGALAGGIVTGEARAAATGSLHRKPAKPLAVSQVVRPAAGFRLKYNAFCC
ncbi:MAG: hypothetical protein Pg6A_13500 [Termitinemataceae bacterium]|nr:MAG: hypothetical protein Pg6A_13500 [Termitinemataceae bacterium]